jgi:hypothetical protein
LLACFYTVEEVCCGKLRLKINLTKRTYISEQTLPTKLGIPSSPANFYGSKHFTAF